MPVYLSNRQKALPINETALRRRLGRLLRELGLAGASLSVSLVDDDQMRALNRRYLRRNRPTNVLAFPQSEAVALNFPTCCLPGPLSHRLLVAPSVKGPGAPPLGGAAALTAHTLPARPSQPALAQSPPVKGPGAPPLGDVVVSTETVLREVGEPAWAGFTVGGLLYFHLVHGLTHLLGYDHERGPAEADRQEAETDRLWSLIRHTL